MSTLAVVALTVAGFALGCLAAIVIRGRSGGPTVHSDPVALIDVDQRVADSLLPLLRLLAQSSIVVTASGEVLHASPDILTAGVVAGDRLTDRGVAALVGEAVTADGAQEQEMQLPRSPGGRVLYDARVRVAPLSPSLLVVLIQDLSEARRIEEVRRDFVANVSHELKTPVGALALLAEAVEAASEDPAQVRHFAGRMRKESDRLATLIADIIDLSRLQGDHPLDDAQRVSVDHVVSDAVDATQFLAASRRIAIVRGGVGGLEVLGDRHVLAAAVRNLLSNAIAYSPDDTRVAVGTRVNGDMVEITVTDQGIGIAPGEQERIFERFYRVDSGRSRGTGGTGLGLSIVKHVCVTHGGDVSVWSRPGEGSTFTMRIPRMAEVSPVPSAVEVGA